MDRPLISIVVPARNEPALGNTTAQLRKRFPAAELIVVDTATRPEIKTRAQAMNAGAKAANGQTLIFLHADCELPEGADREAARAIELGALGGGFLKSYRPSNPLLLLQSAFLNRLSVLDGANALFVQKQVFDTWGGYPDWPLFEDVWLADRLRQTGRMALLPSLVTASSRKYRGLGGLPRILRNGLVYSLYRAGIPPHVLARIY